MMPHEVFVDSGAWIALTIERDAHHNIAVDEYRQLVARSVSLITTNLVIGESYALIYRFGGHEPAIRFLGMLRRHPALTKLYSDAHLEDEAEVLLTRYADQNFTFVDAVSFAAMRSRGMTEAFAFDHHFQVAGFTVIPSLG